MKNTQVSFVQAHIEPKYDYNEHEGDQKIFVW